MFIFLLVSLLRLYARILVIRSIPWIAGLHFSSFDHTFTSVLFDSARLLGAVCCLLWPLLISLPGWMRPRLTLSPNRVIFNSLLRHSFDKDQ